MDFGIENLVLAVFRPGLGKGLKLAIRVFCPKAHLFPLFKDFWILKVRLKDLHLLKAKYQHPFTGKQHELFIAHGRKIKLQHLYLCLFPYPWYKEEWAALFVVRVFKPIKGADGCALDEVVCKKVHSQGFCLGPVKPSLYEVSR